MLHGLVPTLLGVTISVLAFFLFLSNDAFGLFSSNVDPTLTSFFVFMIGLIVTERLASLLSAHEQTRKMRFFEDKIFQAANLTIIGKPGAGKRYIFDRIKDVKLIDNTHINFGKDQEAAESRFYSSPEYKRFKADIIRRVNAGSVVWRDIVNESSLSHVHDLISNKQSNPDCTYQARAVRDAERINFTIVHYKHGEPELLVGWDYGRRLTEPTVVAINETRIVSVFIQHFETMWNDEAREVKES